MTDLNSIPNDFENEQEFLIDDEHLATTLGSGSLEVLGTPALIALMENTAYSKLDDFLGDEFTTVGVKIDVDHLNATLKGEKIIIKAELVKKDKMKLFFNLEAWWSDIKIGGGKHERFVIDKKRFMARLEENKAKVYLRKQLI